MKFYRPISVKHNLVTRPSPTLRQRAASAALLLFLIGCSASKQMASKANDVVDNAQSGKDSLVEARNAISIGADPLPPINDADGAFDSIIEATQAIHELLPGVRDITPWWVPLLMAAVVVLGLITIAYMFGPAIRVALPWLIPHRKRSAAKLLVEGSADEAVALLREDREFDAAYKSEKKKLKLNGKA